nr:MULTISPECIES: histone-like nucleoid-structuring protein Lsr2 [unclassified Streptomyces]
MRLPGDYKELASSYGPGAFCGFIHLYHPLGFTEWVNLTGPMPARIRGQLQQERGRAGYPVPYDPRDLFAMGVTDNGEYLFWVGGPETESADWHIAVNEARGPGWYHFEGNLTRFLFEVLSGHTKIPLFPDGLLYEGVSFSPASAPRHQLRPPAPDRIIAPQAVRLWARANGYQVPDHGRIPAQITNAWEENNPT